MTIKPVLMIAYTSYLFDARVRREAEALADLDEYVVRVLVLREHAQARIYELDKVTVEELDVVKYRGESKIRYVFSYFHFLILAFMSCTKKFLKGDLDLIHIHNMPNFLVFAALIPRMFGKKMILDIHDSVPESYVGKFETSASRIIFKSLCLEERISCALTHKIVCVNQVQRDALIRRGMTPEKTVVVMNVPDPARFSLTKVSRSDKDNGVFKLVYHGTVAKRLGVSLIIRAVAKLADDLGDLQLHLIGLGMEVDLDNLAQLSKELGVESRVFFPDKVPLDQIPEILAEMDLGVVPNSKNLATDLMLPVKLMEYVALGIPVVAARLKTIQCYFSDDMIAYFEPDHVDSLANTIRDLYLNETKRIRQSKKALTFMEKYGWETHKLELIHLYKNLLQTQEGMKTSPFQQNAAENAQC